MDPLDNVSRNRTLEARSALSGHKKLGALLLNKFSTIDNKRSVRGLSTPQNIKGSLDESDLRSIQGESYAKSCLMVSKQGINHLKRKTK